MIVVAIVVLSAGALFNVVAWPTFLRRVARDPRSRDAAGRRTPFFTVHLVLVAIAMTIAAASLVAAVALGAGLR